MIRFEEADDPRRRILIQALAGGLLSGTGAMAQAQGLGIFGSKPAKLPPGQSIYGLSGQVAVNDIAATLATQIRPGDNLQTGKNSEVIFVVGTHSMILRGESRLLVQPPENSTTALVVAGLRLLAGKLLSVSRNTSMQLTTATATIGIRGTGFYVEADPEQTYFCTCYGLTEIAASADPESRETVAASRHDRPLYIVADGARGKNIRNAPFINHTDQELALIETLVGRKTPFVFSKDAYTAPRRTY